MLVDIDWRSHEIEQDGPDGDSIKTGITVEIKPFSYLAQQRLMTFAQKSGFGADSENEQAYGVKMVGDGEFTGFLKDELPKHARNIVGLDVKIDGGERAATIDDLVEHGAFISFAMNIFAKISLISSIQTVELTNLKKK